MPERIPVEWWPRQRFAGRSIRIWSPGAPTVYIPIADDDIVCDLCDADIDLDPVPVIGSYALCADCCVRVYRFDPRYQRPDFVVED